MVSQNNNRDRLKHCNHIESLASKNILFGRIVCNHHHYPKKILKQGEELNLHALYYWVGVADFLHPQNSGGNLYGVYIALYEQKTWTAKGCTDFVA